MKIKQFEYRGVTYNSFHNACKVLGVNYTYAIRRKNDLNLSYTEVMDYFMVTKESKPILQKLNMQIEGKSIYNYWRLNKCSVEEAIHGLLQNKRQSLKYRYLNERNIYVPKKQFKFRNRTYINLRHACQDLKFSYGSMLEVKNRLKLSNEEVLDYYSIKQCCEECYNNNNIRPNTKTVYNFWKSNNTLSYQEATDIIYNRIIKYKQFKQENTVDVSFEYRNKRYANLKIACEELGIKYASARQYKYIHKLTPQQLLDHYML